MKFFIAIKLGAFFLPVFALAAEAPVQGAASGVSTSAEAGLFSKEQQAAAIADLEKKFPVKGWKTIGFCGYKKEPVVLLKVPSFLKWDPECNLHHFKKDIEFCGPSESSPRLSGVFEFEGHKRTLQVGLEAFVGKKSATTKYDATIFNGTWKSAGALKSVQEIKLGGYPAFQAEIEDHTGKLAKTIKSQTLIKFSHDWVGGMLYFIEAEATQRREIYVWHEDWIFQWTVDRVISSFEYKVKVN